MKSVGFFLISPFTKRDYNRFGIEILKKKFNVYVFDLSILYDNNFNDNLSKTYHFDNYFSISSLDVSQFDKFNLDFAIDFLDISPLSYKIRSILKINKTSISKVQNALIPESELKNNIPFIKKIIKNIFKLSSWRNIIFSFQKLINPKIFFESDEIFVGGSSGENLIASTFSKNIIPSHSFDYDIFLDIDKKKNVFIEKYIVFVDQNLAFHTDIKFLKLNQVVTAEKYYQSLEMFFQKFEYLYGLKLIIAAHPRSNYELYPNIFKGRDVIKGNTPELIKCSSHVIMHASTSVSFAVLWNKPISFVTTDEISDSFYFINIKMNANLFCKKIINIDNYNIDEIKRSYNDKINHDLYSRYKKEFIFHPNSPNKFFWEIYSDYALNK